MVRTLSKSKVMRGLQCHKNLYLHTHFKNLEPKPSAAQQAVFDQGNAVGVEARRRFPGGTLITAEHYEIRKALEQTRAAIASGASVLYEATFEFGGIVSRADILHRKDIQSSWEMTEVKSSTQLKDEHLQDAAIQAWILRGAGLNLEHCHVMHLNREYVQGRSEHELFARHEITAQMTPLLEEVPNQVRRLQEMLNEENVPSVDLGPHCSSPYECPFTEHCREEKLIPYPSVLDLPRLGARKWEFYRQGILRLDDPRLVESEGAQNVQALRMIEASGSGKRFVDRKAIAHELLAWQWPLYYLDFETISPAIPRFVGTRPYQHVPFQFSSHLQLAPGQPLFHQEYLHPDETDPREALADALVKAVGPKGSVVAYYHSFEGARLAELAEAIPIHRDALLSIRERLVDPLPIFQNHVYDAEFAGSFSIKAVAPAILGKSASYSEMSVGDGIQAQLAFAEMAAPGTSLSRKSELRQALLEYCKKDTFCMVALVEWLYARTQSE